MKKTWLIWAILLLFFSACGGSSQSAHPVTTTSLPHGPVTIVVPHSLPSVTLSPSSSILSPTTKVGHPSTSTTSVVAPVATEFQIAIRYIAAVESAPSYNRSAPLAYLADVKPLMTPEGYIAKYGNTDPNSPSSGGTGVDWQWLHDHKESVIAHPICNNNLEGPVPTPTSVELVCTATVTTVDTTGKPAVGLPPGWDLNGPSLYNPYVLEMVKVNGLWLVGHDNTGPGGA